MLVPRLRAWTLIPGMRASESLCFTQFTAPLEAPVLPALCVSPLRLVPVSTPTHTPFHTGSSTVSPGLHLALCTSQRGSETFPYQTAEGCL